MMNKVVNKKFYVEVEIKNGDVPYVMQSKWFPTPQLALMWFEDGFEHYDEDRVNVYIMVANYYDEEDYEIEQFCKVVNYRMHF